MSVQTDDFTELVDPNIDRVDVVDKAANGTTILFAKSAEPDGQAGLFAPEFVREQVEKAEAAEPPAGPVTLTGSPAAVADMMARMHGAPVRKAEAPLDIAPDLDRVVKSADGGYVAFVKAKYSAEDKRKLAAKGHAMRADDGTIDYPIDDEEDLGKAIRAVGRGGADHDKIRKYVIGRAKALGKSDQIPDNWASDGSLKAPVAKADGDPADPGSPAWESQDAASAEGVVGQILACIPSVKKLAMREATEVGAGHLDDICDVLELQAAIDQLTCAAKTVAAFAVGEHVEAGESVTKAQDAPSPAAPAAPAPKESIVSETQGATGAENVAKTEATEQVTKASDLIAQLGISQEQLAQLGLQSLLKAAADANTQTSGASQAPADNARVIPGTDTVQAPAATDDVAKAQANQLVSAIEAVMAPLAKQLSELAGQVGTQSERVEKAMARPDDRKSPALNGATGTATLAGRGDLTNSPVNSEAFQEVRKALAAMPDGPEKENAQRAVAIAGIKGRFGHSG